LILAAFLRAEHQGARQPAAVALRILEDHARGRERFEPTPDETAETYHRREALRQQRA
jgi:hypothetical protein